MRPIILAVFLALFSCASISAVTDGKASKILKKYNEMVPLTFDKLTTRDEGRSCNIHLKDGTVMNRVMIWTVLENEITYNVKVKYNVPVGKRCDPRPGIPKDTIESIECSVMSSSYPSNIKYDCRAQLGSMNMGLNPLKKAAE